jgi:hypothetical protein
MSTRQHNPRSRQLMALRADIARDPGTADHLLFQAALKQLEPIYRDALTWLWNAGEWVGSPQLADALGVTQQRAGELLHGLWELGFLARDKRTLGGRVRNAYRSL